MLLISAFLVFDLNFFYSIEIFRENVRFHFLQFDEIL